MPRDVATRWNSTFNLLEYALKHRRAVDLLTQRRDLGLRKFELSDNEWVIVKQLHSVLKVSKHVDSTCLIKHTQMQFDRSSRTPHFSSRAQRQTSRWSSQRWTTSIKNLQRIHTIENTFCPSVLASPWLSRLSTITIVAQTPQRCIGLRWVNSLLAFHSTVNLHQVTSTPPKAQTFLLQDCMLARQMDQDS